MNIDGSTALVTGSGAGIGRGIARSLARRGARLALTDIDPASLASVAKELEALTDVVAEELDVRDRDRFAAVVDRVEDRLGPVDVLCNNAGVAVPESVAAMEYPLWDLLLEVNLGGVVNGLQTVVPRMVSRGRPGHVVNTASAAGLLPAAGYAYTASKYAVVGLSESLRQRLHHEDHQIGVTVLCPGAVATDLARTSDRALAAEVGASVTELAERIHTMDTALRSHGADPDRVGDLVTTAIAEDRLYVFTDRSGADMIADRFRAILDALPDGDVTGGSAEAFLEAARGVR